jgi:exodeoxyribonuclease-3
MKIATWNVNSMNVRLPHVVEWLQSHEPDVLVLQEIKQLTENFPTEALQEIGYHSIASGQKTYNGVAVISKTPATDPVADFPDLDDPQRRILASTVDAQWIRGRFREVRVQAPLAEVTTQFSRSRDATARECRRAR